MKNTKFIKGKVAILSGLVVFSLLGGLTFVWAGVIQPITKPTQSPLPTSLTPLIPPAPMEPEIIELPEPNLAKPAMELRSCVVPYVGMYIYADTVLCQDEYQFPDLNGYFILFGSDNITLDCNGARLIGTYDAEQDIGRSFGIYNNAYDNITIKNCTLDSFYVSIYNRHHSNDPLDNVTIENNTFNLSSQWYMYLENVNNSYIDNNTKPEGSGELGWPTVHMINSNNNIIINNDFYGHAGIRLLMNSNNNDINNNNLGYIPLTAEQRVALSIDRGSEYNNVYDNYLTDIPDGYALGLFGHGDSETAYGAAYNNTFYNNSFRDVQFGVFINHDTAENHFQENDFENITYNAYLLNPYQADGIWYYPHLNTFENNSVNNAYRDVVLTNGVHDNTFSYNTFENSQDAALLFYNYTSPSNKITDNDFENNRIINPLNVGLKFEANAAENNVFATNLIKNATDRGLYILSGNNSNVFINNTFVNNDTQAYDAGTGNVFDQDGNGNYWHNFDEPIEGCMDTDINGICDTPYTDVTGTAGSIDNFPLTQTTVVQDLPPYTPALPNPENESVDVDTTLNIDWFGGDPDPGDTVTYDIYFGDTDTPPLVEAGWSNTSYHLDVLDNDVTYYWKIVSRDAIGNTTEGLVWNFTTFPPYVCGDADNDGVVNILDVVYLINYKYKKGAAPDPLLLGDVNYDWIINILDIVHLINWKYKNGPPPFEIWGFCKNY